MSKRYTDPGVPLSRLIGGVARQAMPHAANPEIVLTVTSVDSTNHLLYGKRAGDAASNGLPVPYTMATAPTAGQRVQCLNLPSGVVAIRTLI